jgi:tripartite-type tricarboxylate transporter receptor subunit TctC
MRLEILRADRPPARAHQKGKSIMRTRTLATIFAAIAMATCGFRASAETFPAKPVTIVVPFPAGGALDTVARSLAEEMRKTLDQPIIVENKAGAGGTVGSALVARAAPDGYTILLGSVATHAIAAGLYSKLPYDPIKDFSPITQLTGAPLVLAVPEQLKVSSVEELIAAAKKQPGTFNYASTGNGTAVHLAGELFKDAAGIKVEHIPYKGGPQATTAMLAGDVAFMIGNTQLVLPFIRSGKMRGLAVTGKKRLDALPELRTLEESGVSGVDITTWFGFFAPAGTPRNVINRLNSEAVKALSTDAVKRQLTALGDHPVGTSVDDFSAFVRSEHQRWVSVTNAAGIRLD